MTYPEWLLKFLQGALILVFGPLSGQLFFQAHKRRSITTNDPTGVAFCLSAWVTPTILRPENPSKSEIAQFSETVERGMKYLQPSSRLSGFLMLAVTLLISQHPDPSESWKWKLYAAAFLIVIQVAWYEIYFIFPINDTIKAMGSKLGANEQSLREPDQKRLHDLLLKWELRHRVRIATPFFGCVVAVVAVLI